MRLVSIVGDSISTFEGYNPAGYSVYYNKEAQKINQIKTVYDTWWAKAVSDASWSGFYRKLEYKISDHGGILVKVPRTYASSQICSCCGRRNPEVKDLNVRIWTCPACGAEHDRDVNAAINILNKGLEMLAS